MAAAGIVMVVCALLVAAPAQAADHMVGGSSGWTTGVDYDTWAAAQAFAAGDTLTFKYGSLHSVYQVSKSAYESCSTSNAIATDGSGATTVKLSQPATTYYFICGTPGHCSEGMKLSVTTAAASSSSSPASSSSNSPPTTANTVQPSSSTSPSAAGLGLGLSALLLLVC